MYYPLNLLRSDTVIRPLLGDQIRGNPYIFDFTSDNSASAKIDTAHFDAFQKAIYDTLAEQGASWGLGGYLQERKNLLRNYPQIVNQGRYYHLGLDIVVPKGTVLFAPLHAKVVEVGKEEGFGNYGGYVLLQHLENEVSFYSFYGHLDTNHMVTLGQQLSAGEAFAKVGGEQDSGGWFEHTHLQILTERGFREGFISKGYCAAELFPTVDQLCPSPLFLLRY